MDYLLDVLEDPELLAEVRLMTDLMIAVNQHHGRLTPEVLDRLLGL